MKIENLGYYTARNGTIVEVVAIRDRRAVCHYTGSSMAYTVDIETGWRNDGESLFDIIALGE